MPSDFIPMNPLQVEAEIMRLSSLLEDRVSDFTQAIRAAAEAEAEWKRSFAVAMLDVIESATGSRMTVAEREARVEVMTSDQHRVYLITTATSKAVKEALNALGSQIEALRTLSANHRALARP